MFIGTKQIKSYKQFTLNEIALIEITYNDNTKEILSKLMFDKVKSDKSYDDTTLRDKRIFPVVEELLKVLHNWGVKLNELALISALLNTSLEENKREALNELWSKWTIKPQSPDDIDLVTIDRVLRNRKISLTDIIKKSEK